MKPNAKLLLFVTIRFLAAVFWGSVLLSPGLACGQTVTIDAKSSANIEERIRKSGAEVAIAFRTLDGYTAYSVHDDESFHAASTMKIPVMIELFLYQARRWPSLKAG